MKSTGIALWIVTAIIAILNIVHFDIDPLKMFLLSISISFGLGMLIYNFLWGNQRGHYVHLFMIAMAFGLSLVVTFFRRNTTDLQYALLCLAYSIVVLLVGTRFRRKFVADYKNKITHDYFEERAKRDKVRRE